MIGMGAEASTIVRAVAADFFFDCSDVEIPSDECIRDIPWSVHYHAQGFRLESFQDFYVGGGSSASELYTIGPDGFENCFIEEEFVGGGELRLASEQPIYFGEGEAKLFPFSENVFMPGKLSV
jgi:hypothetical protein